MSHNPNQARGGMNKGLAAGLAIAAASVAYISYSTKETPRQQPSTINKPSNRMVEEKVSSQDTKSSSEKKLEGYAENKVKDTSVLVKKDSEKVKPVANSPQEPTLWTSIWGPTHRILEETSTAREEKPPSLWSYFFGREETVTDKTHKLIDTAADKLKHETPFSNDKSWYDKKAEQVKTSLGAIKSKADKDMNLVGQKVQHTVASAKHQVHRVLEEEEQTDLSSYLHTRLNPAELIVQNARGREM